MYIEQLYTNCLSEAAYYIESDGQAMIVDPLRETEPYLEKAKERGAEIKYVFETHFHADFVSGHIDLAAATGAAIVYGPGAKTNFEIIEAKDEQEFTLGKLKIKVLHTPGHTPESSCYLLFNEAGEPHAIFTGDTLFIGDVGRPDLAQKVGEVTAEDMAATLYDSLREKIMPLPDTVIVYPAHGAGSACGKKMAKETFATLGHQRASNYALSDISKEDFVKELTDGIPPPPSYFSQAAHLNKFGYDSLETLYENSLQALDPAAFLEAGRKTGTIAIDTRHQDDFRKDHIPGALFIGLNGQFAPWAGALIPKLDQPIIIIADEGKEKEAVLRLARVGFSGVVGYLEGGIEAWRKAELPLISMPSVTAEEFLSVQGQKALVDVRKHSEFDAGHLGGAISSPLDFLNEDYLRYASEALYYVHCQSGYRSMIAVSLLRSKGIMRVVDIKGGFEALKEAGALVLTDQHVQ